MKNLLHLLITQNRCLLEQHQAMVQQYQCTLKALESVLEDDHDLQVSPVGSGRSEFLPPQHESAFLDKLISSPSGRSLSKAKITLDTPLPKHVSISFILRYLEISESTFYRQVNGKLLEVAFRIGNRPYYLLDDLLALVEKKNLLHREKGDWTFAKMNRMGQREDTPPAAE